MTGLTSLHEALKWVDSSSVAWNWITQAFQEARENLFQDSKVNEMIIKSHKLCYVLFLTIF